MSKVGGRAAAGASRSPRGETVSRTEESRRARRNAGIWAALLGLAAALTLSLGGTAPAANGCTLNQVACENQLPGNPRTEWDVNGSGDPSIQGYATDISVDHGQTVRFKVK